MSKIDLPVVVVTAVDEPGEIAYLKQCGAARVFVKSRHDVREMVACIDELLKKPPGNPTQAA